MARVRFETASYAGRAGYNALCPEDRCGQKFFGVTKSKAQDEWERHDKREHRPDRERAEKATKEQERERKEDERDAKEAAKRAKKDGGVVIKGRKGYEVITDPKDSRLSRKQRKQLEEHIRKERYDALKGKVGSKNAEILSRLDETPRGKIHQIKGLHTYGIPNVPDGQNVNGLVYDKDGVRVTHDVLSRYVQGWGD